MESTGMFIVIFIVHDDQEEIFSSAIIIVFAVPHHIPPIPVTSNKYNIIFRQIKIAHYYI